MKTRTMKSGRSLALIINCENILDYELYPKMSVYLKAGTISRMSEWRTWWPSLRLWRTLWKPTDITQIQRHKQGTPLPWLVF